MADKIGPTFGAELTAAGLGDGISWDCVAGTLQFTSVSAADQTKALQALAAHDPTRQMPRTATAKQVRYALNDLGVRQTWDAAVAASPQPDQDYWHSADPMYEANGKVAKWCKAAGVTPRQLFDRATAE